MGSPCARGLLEQQVSDGRGALALAEKILAMLELGSFSATYKYALFISLLDLVLERASKTGAPPTSVTTRQLAEKVVELYWPHATPYEGSVLRQGGVRAGSQAEIVRAIGAFRLAHAGCPDELLFRAQRARPDEFERLLRGVEWKLIEMPIPRLQIMGQEEDRFLYQYGWTKDVKRSTVAAYQRGEPSEFNSNLTLVAGVAEHLMQLNGVLRPVVQREWTLMVAAMNALPEARLDDFLFGASRIPLEAVRGPLRDLQSNRCFYCEGRMHGPADVDHFIPWARYPDNRLDNLVVAHPRCNHAKRDFFAAAEHVERWKERARRDADDLATLAAEATWERDLQRSQSVALAMYTRLADSAKLWLVGSELVVMDRPRILEALRSLAA
jgi:hypothetical protein